jgi:hypothetical protein
MTDIAATNPMKITVYPQSPASGTGRIVNANATIPNVPDSPQFWGQSGFSFKSFLDIVNPLQHIPGVSTIYQAATGDIPSAGSDISGGGLYGGVAGMMASVANEITKSLTGDSIGGHIFSLLQGITTQTAQNTDSSGSVSFLTTAQRTAYNAYVRNGQSSTAGSYSDISA